MHMTTEWQGWLADTVSSQRATVKVDMERVSSPTNLGVPSQGMGPWVQALISNFLKIELKGRLRPMRALSFLVQGCNSTPAIPAPLVKRALPLNHSNLQDLLTSFLYFPVELACLAGQHAAVQLCSQGQGLGDSSELSPWLEKDLS